MFVDRPVGRSYDRCDLNCFFSSVTACQFSEPAFGIRSIPCVEIFRAPWTEIRMICASVDPDLQDALKLRLNVNVGLVYSEAQHVSLQWRCKIYQTE